MTDDKDNEHDPLSLLYGAPDIQPSYHEKPLEPAVFIKVPIIEEKAIPYCKSNPKFDALLREIGDLHDRKNAGYAGSVDGDPLANFRLAERVGVSTFKGIIIRKTDKFMRILSLIRRPSNNQVNESLRDSLVDDMVYAGLAIIALDEDPDGATQSPQPED